MPKSTTHIIGRLWASTGPNRNGDIFPKIKFTDDKAADTTIFAIAEGIAAELRSRFSHVSFTVRRRVVLKDMRVTDGMSVSPNAASVCATVSRKIIFEIRLFDTIILVTPLVLNRPNPLSTSVHMEDYTDQPVGEISAEAVKGEFEYANPRTLERLYEACGEILAS